MYPGGYTAQVTSLSPNATEKDVNDFFSHCGVVDHVEIISGTYGSGEHAYTAYVTFRDAYALETAILLSGATIVDQSVCITCWGAYTDDLNPSWNSRSQNTESNISSTVYHTSQFVSSPGEAVTMTQEVVKTLLAKGYVLGKDALVKAKAFDESYQVSATAAAKVVDISKRIGLTDKICASMEVVKSADQKYHVSDITRSVATATGTAALTAATITGSAATAAGTAIVNSSYFAKGAHLVSEILSRAAKAAADLGTQGSK